MPGTTLAILPSQIQYMY